MLSSLEKNYIRPKFASVIYNGRTPSLFDSYVSKENYAISVGRIWDFGKNAVLLRKIEAPMPIYLAGSNQEPSATEFSVSAEQAGGVFFKGVQNENQLRQLYSRASIYIATSQYEPFGLAPLEAALSRCAIVASDIPSFREIWGETACYFTSNDPQSLQAALEMLDDDPELCASYGQLAYKRAIQRFTSSRMAEDYSHLYQAMTRAGVRAGRAARSAR